MSDAKRFVVIDGKSVFYRGYYALPYLSTKEGIATGGVFGFATMAFEVLRRLKPDYVAVAWDKPKTNIRKRLELYPEYKAGRKPAPADFYQQIPILKQLLDALGWPLYELDDYEADDIMGTLAVQAKGQEIETMVITSDLDMLQIIDDKVHVYALKTGLTNIELYSPKTFETKYHLKVNQFLDYKAMRGDSSDNIPGIPGIGEKGATELLQKFGSLDGIYDNLELIKDSLKNKLINGKDSAYLSKELARIWTDAPLKLNIPEIDGSKIKPKEVIQILEELEFKSLLNNLPDGLKQAVGQYSIESKSLINNLETVFIDNENQLKKIMPKSNIVTLHCVFKDKYFEQPLLICLNFDDNKVYCLNQSLLKKAIKTELKRLFKDKKVIGYDVKAFFRYLLNLKLSLPEVAHDIQIGAFLLDPLGREKTLSELAVKTTGYSGSNFEDLDPSQLSLATKDIIFQIKAIHDTQTKSLKNLTKLNELAKNLEWPIIAVLAKMEHIGITLDKKYLGRFAEDVGDLISDYTQEIYGYADQEFNIDSPAQLASILFDKLKLPTFGIKKGKSEYSTAASELDKLRGLHPIIEAVSQYREVAKLKNTYIDPLPEMTDKTSRIHTTFNLTIAQTGRLSSTDPNLQNIPIRTELGKSIRRAFIATQGKKLISADYSQFELRLAAVLASDVELINMFNDGADIHARTAAQIYGRAEEDVTKQMRRAAKVINFGILYGMSPHGLSIATGMTRDQASDFIDRYKQLRKPIFEYIETIKEIARKDGYVETLFGRRRPTPDIKSKNFIVRSAAERAAINLPIQGTEADLMKMAMIKIDEQLSKKYPEANMLVQVHDSILVEAEDKDCQDVAKLLQHTMQGIYKLPVKLDVDVGIGQNWSVL